MDDPGWSVTSPKVGHPEGPVSTEEWIFVGLAGSTQSSWFCMQWPAEGNPEGKIKHLPASVCLHGRRLGKKNFVSCWLQTNLKMAILSKSGTYFALLRERFRFRKIDSRLMSTQGSRKGLGTNSKINVGIAGKLEGADRPWGGGDSPLPWWGFLAKSACLIP